MQITQVFLLRVGVRALLDTKAFPPSPDDLLPGLGKSCFSNLVSGVKPCGSIGGLDTSLRLEEYQKSQRSIRLSDAMSIMLLRNDASNRWTNSTS